MVRLTRFPIRYSIPNSLLRSRQCQLQRVDLEGSSRARSFAGHYQRPATTAGSFFELTPKLSTGIGRVRTFGAYSYFNSLVSI
jgi:hypothetical protein